MAELRPILHQSLECRRRVTFIKSVKSRTDSRVPVAQNKHIDQVNDLSSSKTSVSFLIFLLLEEILLQVCVVDVRLLGRSRSCHRASPNWSNFSKYDLGDRSKKTIPHPSKIRAPPDKQFRARADSEPDLQLLLISTISNTINCEKV